MPAVTGKTRRTPRGGNAAKLEKARGLVIDRTIELIKSDEAADGTSVKWNGTDGNGEKRTVEYSLADIAAAIEKLSRSAGPAEGGDDPLAAFLRRLDDEAAAQ